MSETNTMSNVQREIQHHRKLNAENVYHCKTCGEQYKLGRGMLCWYAKCKCGVPGAIQATTEKKLLSKLKKVVKDV